MSPRGLSLVAKPMEHTDQRTHHCWTFVLMSYTEAKKIHDCPIEPDYLCDHVVHTRGIIILTPTGVEDHYIYEPYGIDKKLDLLIPQIADKLTYYANYPSFRPSMHVFADYIRL